MRSNIEHLDYIEHWMEIWQRREYWEGSRRTEGFISLPEMFDANTYTGKQKIMVAKGITRLFDKLHTHCIIPKDFEMDDIFVSESQQVKSLRQDAYAIYRTFEGC